MIRKHIIIWSIIACLILVACSPDMNGNQTSSINSAKPKEQTTQTSEISPEDTSDIISGEDSASNEPTPDRSERESGTVVPEIVNPLEMPDSSPIVGEVPEKILDEIIQDLLQRTKIEKQNIEVVRAQAVTWNDGSLGCPKPGEFYSQVLVDGYWLILQVDGVEYDYRVSQSGYFKLCDEGRGIPLSPPGGTPEK